MSSCPLLCSGLAFEKGHCYEPYIQNGNFTTSDPTYNIGTVVEFTCDPGHSLEQGPAIIECINVRDPYWNDTEPLCRGEWVTALPPGCPRALHSFRSRDPACVPILGLEPFPGLTLLWVRFAADP